MNLPNCWNFLILLPMKKRNLTVNFYFDGYTLVVIGVIHCTEIWESQLFQDLICTRDHESLQIYVRGLKTIRLRTMCCHRSSCVTFRGLTPIANCQGNTVEKFLPTFEFWWCHTGSEENFAAVLSWIFWSFPSPQLLNKFEIRHNLRKDNSKSVI